MKLTITSADHTIHFFTAYALQAGPSDAEKDPFWQLLDAKTYNVPADDRVIIAVHSPIKLRQERTGVH